MTIFAFLGAVVVEAIARGVVSGSERRRRKAIEKLHDHTIICGYGRVGQRIADEFHGAGADFVIVDNDPEEVEAAREAGMLAVEGDAIEDEDLRAAGLERAKALIAALDSDANNLYVTLSARNVRPDLLIVSRASDEDAERKLRLAGADRVVMPYSTAGRVMANLVLKPQVASFLNVVTTPGRPGPALRADRSACRLPGHREIDPRSACQGAHRRLDRRRGQEEEARTTRVPRRRPSSMPVT